MPLRELTDMEQARLLTQSEVDLMPTGRIVMVKWSGGNGPHPYLIIHHRDAAYVAGFRSGNEMFIADKLDPVGHTRAHHRVFAIE
jgi:hemolysin-activating ACP:hemolysin acyltransferase